MSIPRETEPAQIDNFVVASSNYEGAYLENPSCLQDENGGEMSCLMGEVSRISIFNLEFGPRIMVFPSLHCENQTGISV